MPDHERMDPALGGKKRRSRHFANHPEAGAAIPLGESSLPPGLLGVRHADEGVPKIPQSIVPHAGHGRRHKLRTYDVLCLRTDHRAKEALANLEWETVLTQRQQAAVHLVHVLLGRLEVLVLGGEAANGDRGRRGWVVCREAWSKAAQVGHTTLLGRG